MKDKQCVKIDGYEGTWYAIGEDMLEGEPIYLMESCQLGEDVPAIIIDKNNKVVKDMDDVRNGFADLWEVVQWNYDNLE